MAHDTSDLLSFYLKQQQTYLACKAHFVREYCHQAHSRQDLCAGVHSAYSIVLDLDMLSLQPKVMASPLRLTVVGQGGMKWFEGSAPALPSFYCLFPVRKVMFCCLAFAPNLQKRHLLKVHSLLCTVAPSYKRGFLHTRETTSFQV